MIRTPVLLSALLLLPLQTLSHGGGLDKNGGHYNRKSGEYHCHRCKAPPFPTKPSIDIHKDVLWHYDGEQWEPNRSPPACTDELDISIPVDLEKVTGVLYPGQFRGGGFRPHGGFRFDSSKPDDITVHAPGSGYLVRAGRYKEQGETQYILDIQSPCGVIYRLDHAAELSPKLQHALAFLPPPQANDSRQYHLHRPLEIVRGELLATTAGFRAPQNVFIDFGVYDLRRRNSVTAAKDWPDNDFGWPELAPFGVCWLELLPDHINRQLYLLPTGGEGGNSRYCQ